MRLSHTHKFVFLAVPRSGSTSMRAMLDPVSDAASGHITESETYHHISYRQLVAQHSVIAEYRKFVVMRDPYERFRSLFFHHMKNIDGIVRQVNRVSPAVARVLFALLRCLRKGPLTGEVRSYTAGAPFKVFALEDPRLRDRLQDYLGTELGPLPHLNAIEAGSDGNIKRRERALVRWLYRHDLALYERVRRDGSAQLDA